MHWIRRGFLHLLAILLLACLLGVAFSFSVNQNLRHPAKIEAWLSQSKLYDHFVSTATDQAKKSAGDNSNSSGVSLSDTAVQQAAQSAFSPQFLQKNVNTFLDSNYAWLEGKTSTPDFKIDLTQAKLSFAQQVGKYVQMHLATLPVCTPAQTAVMQAQGMQNIDPLAIPCRPPTLIPETEGAQVTQQIASSGDFLSKPVITASTINPDQTSQSKPYYQKFSKAPQLYQLSQKIPYVLGALAILCAVAITFVAQPRRKGLRRISIILLEAGVILVLTRLLADFTFKKLEKRVFNNNNNGPLQQSLTDFVHRVQTAMVKTDLLFGIIFIVLAVVIIAVLVKTRPPKEAGRDTSKAPPERQADTKPAAAQPVLDPTRPKLKKNPRPPRLIQ